MITVPSTTLSEAKQCIQQEPFVLLYLSRPGCGVCAALRPKIETILETLPKAVLCTVDLERVPEAAAEFSVFTVPATILFLEGRETIREARYLSVEDLRERMIRLYALRFER